MRRIARVFIIVAVVVGAAQAAAVEEENPGTSADLLSFERADIAVFREKLLNVDRSFTKKTRAQAERRLRRLEQSDQAIDLIDFAVELCRVAALADNAHTGCLSAPLARAICREFANLDGGTSSGCVLNTPDFNVPDFDSVPLRFFPFGSAFHVVAAKAADSDLLGARLVAIDGRSVNGILEILRTFSGGTVPHRDLYAAGVLSSPDQLHAVGVSRQSAAVTYRVVTPGGRTIERTFKPEHADGGVAAWEGIPSPDRAPWAFEHQEQPFRWRDAPELDAIVVQIRQNVDGANQRIADFLEKVESSREWLGQHNIVLDMRFNGGGNFMLTREFMVHWPDRVPAQGRFFVLTSRITFSAAIATIAYLKQSGKDRVVLIGEAPGDRLMFFSEGRPMQLPHSGLFFRPSTARMDYQTGCRSYDDCFIAIAQPGRPTAHLAIAPAEEIDRMPIAIRSLDPDVPAPWTAQSWFTGADPAMDAVSNMIRK